MSRGLNQGKTPILTSGLKVQPWGAIPRDAQLAEVLKLTEEHIAMVFRIPLAVLGVGGKPAGSTEALMQFWVSTGLGFALSHIESAIELLFGLKGQPDDFVEFDTAALLRSSFKDRIEALARGVLGGIYSPNEARNLEGLPDAEGGESPRVQQQVVPLEAAEAIVPTAHGPRPPAAPAPAAPPAAPAPPTPAKQLPKVDRDAYKRESRRLLNTAARINQRLG
jgi:hypothetical protein